MNKKILFIDHDHRITGSSVSLRYLLDEFKSAGYENILFTPKSKEETKYFGKSIDKFIIYGSSKIRTIALDVHFTDDEPVFSELGFKKFVKSAIKFFYGLFVIYKAIVKTKPDLIYVNEYVVPQASMLGAFLGIPAVVHIRSQFLKKQFPVRRKILAAAVTHLNKLIFPISAAEADQFIELNEKAKLKIIESCEFLDEKNFEVNSNTDELKKTLGIPLNKKIVLMVGGIVPVKGTLDFIKAAEIVLAKRNDAVFLIAGKIFDKGPEKVMKYYVECLSVIHSAKLEKSILLLGEIENIIDVIACSNILISPSTESHFPRPVIEAWAQKKPVIASSIEHNLKLINNNVDGCIAGVNRFDEIASAIDKILSDEDFAGFLGMNGHKKVLGKYSREQGTLKIVKACSALLNTL